MERSLTLAFWMLVLMGCVGGRSTGKSNDFFDFLIEEAKCGPNVTFTSPVPPREGCYASAISTIMQELTAAKSQCGADRATQALKVFKQLSKYSADTNSSGCNNTESLKPFKDFVEDIKVFVEELNSLREAAAQ